MANVSYWQASWVSMEGYPMSPGDVHYWEASPLGYLEAWSVTAVPIAGGEDPTAILGVEDVRVIADASGSRGFLFNVKNVGDFLHRRLWHELWYHYSIKGEKNETICPSRRNRGDSLHSHRQRAEAISRDADTEGWSVGRRGRGHGN
jgi:hypothetical protein